MVHNHREIEPQLLYKTGSGARSKGLKYECKLTIMSNFLKNFSKKGGQNCKFLL